MKRNSQFGAIYGIALTLSLLSPAIAAPGAQPLPVAQNDPPLQTISVFCGAMGCQPVTKVKKCAPDNQNHAASPGQREVIVRRTCNFL